MSSSCSVSTITDHNSARSLQPDFPSSINTRVEDPHKIHPTIEGPSYTFPQRPPFPHLESDPFEMFSPKRGRTLASEHVQHLNPSNEYATASAQSPFLSSLLQICTTSALTFYHSLLPAPEVCVTVRQTLPPGSAAPQDGLIHLSSTTEYYPPHTSPQTAFLCAEALTVTRAADANLPLTHVLDLISHVTGSSTDGHCHPQPLLSESHHAAHMSQLWDLANRLLLLLLSTVGGKDALGFGLGAPPPPPPPEEECSAYQAAREFCEMLGVEEGWHEVDLCWAKYGGYY